MTRRTVVLTAVTCLLVAAAVYAADGLSMKCEAKPEKDPATGKTAKPCGYETEVVFGGMMLSDQLTGYCRHCQRFVYLHWTRPGAPVPAGMKVTPKPKPLGEVWDAASGKIMTVWACPKCKGPFLEIKKREDLKFCPRCNQPHFVVDNDKPRMAID